MNEARLCFSLGILKYFINSSLALDNNKNVTGYNLVCPLLDAAAYNTYIETIGNKADLIYLRTKECLTEMTTYSYLDYIKRISQKFNWKEKEVMLAFDYTDEDFYGDVQGLDIIGWTGKDGVTGKFKFLTCSIVSDEIPEKIPLISIPISMGHYKSYAITYCLDLIKEHMGKVILVLFDRGFYDKDLMYELSQNKFPYLIFVPKAKDKKEILYPMDKGEQVAIYNEFKVNKNKSKYPGENILVFLKEIYDKKSDKEYDWVFATNVEDIELNTIIKTYKKLTSLFFYIKLIMDLPLLIWRHIFEHINYRGMYLPVCGSVKDLRKVGKWNNKISYTVSERLLDNTTFSDDGGSIYTLGFLNDDTATEVEIGAEQA